MSNHLIHTHHLAVSDLLDIEASHEALGSHQLANTGSVLPSKPIRRAKYWLVAKALFITVILARALKALKESRSSTGETKN